MSRPSNTVTQGGCLAKNTIAINIIAKPTSFMLPMLCVRIGETNVAAKIPTTAAFILLTAPRNFGCALSTCQKGRAPIISKKAGKKIASVAIIPPQSPLVSAPKYDAKVNNGPGTACVKP